MTRSNINFALVSAVASAFLSSPAIAGEDIPSPFAPGQSTPSMQAPVGPLKPRPELQPKPDSAPAAALSSPGTQPPSAPSTSPSPSQGKEALIQELMEEIKRLRAERNSSGSGSATADKASPVTDYQNGLVGRVHRVTTGGGEWGNDRAYNPEPDAIYSFPLNTTTFNLGELRKGTNIPLNELIAYRNVGFYQVKEGGRHVFRTTVRRQGKVQPGITGSARCMLGVTIEDKVVSALSGLIDMYPKATNIALTTAGGVDLEPGVYAIEWDVFCSAADGYLDLFTNSLEVQTPSDLSPVEPQPGVLLRKAIAGTPAKKSTISTRR